MAGIRVNVALWGLSIACCLVALYFLATTVNQQMKIAGSYLDYLRAIELSDEMRQTSDDLTRFARAYAVTGDAAYKRRFQAVLDIRDGHAPRPAEYTHSYWDLEIAGVIVNAGEGEARSLRDLLIDAGLDRESLSDLAEAELLSEGLAKIEQDAFAYVERGNTESALKLLYGREYQRIKSQIMIPINRVKKRLKVKGKGNLRKLQERYGTSQTVIIALVLASLVFGALAGLYRRYEIRSYLQSE